MLPLYFHTQPALLIRRALGLMMVLWVVFSIVDPTKNLKPAFFIGLPVTGSILFAFWSMTIEVTTTHLTHSFNFDFWKRSYPLSEIKSVSKGQSSWYNGYGIRYVGSGWLYNVSGTDIIIVDFKDGSQIWLGTDDQETVYNILSESITE